MSLANPLLSSAAWTYDNWGANPSATLGTALTPGSSNADSAWTQVASSANIANEVAGFWLTIGTQTAHSAANHQVLLDVGVDPAGGTSYVDAISDIVCGNMGTGVDRGRAMFFPLRIPSGASVAIRARSANAAAVALRVSIKFYGLVSGPHAYPIGQISETIGAVAATSTGTSFTPGNVADGTWASLGTTTNPLWWWVLNYSVNNATINAEYCYIDLAYGDASNKHVMKRIMVLGSTGENTFELLPGNLTHYDCYYPVPAGATIYVRGRCDSAPDTGYVAAAIGIGG